MTRIKCLLSLLLIIPPIVALASSRSYVVVPEVKYYVPPQNRAILLVLAPIPKGEVRAYIREKAKEAGVNPVIADFIVRKESGYTNATGDSGKSVGPWQIHLGHDPTVTEKCARDLACSTAWSLARIKEGRANLWTTWKYRHKWFDDYPW